MEAGVFDKPKLSAAFAADDARITFKIRVLDKLPSVEVELAGHPNETPADVIREMT